MLELLKYLRNKVTTLIRRAKSIYVKENLHVNRNNQKKFWHKLRSVSLGDDVSNIDIDFVDPSTNTNVACENVPDFLNDYFVHIGNNDVQPMRYNVQMDLPVHNFEPITLREIVNLIKEIDITKDSCIDGISAEIIKHAFLRIPEKLQILFQRSINTGNFPRKWAVRYVNILPNQVISQTPETGGPLLRHVFRQNY